MTLHEIKEVSIHGKRCGIRSEYKHTNGFEYELIILGQTFSSKKLAIKFIDRYDEEQGNSSK